LEEVLQSYGEVMENNIFIHLRREFMKSMKLDKERSEDMIFILYVNLRFTGMTNTTKEH